MTSSVPVYAYLGPRGTFSQMAAARFIDGSSAELLECATIPEIFEAVDSGRATFGVVPIENSLEGSVNATLDAFAFSTSSQILSEKTVDIHHALIAAPGTTLAHVERVVSHPQATGQCGRWIARNLPGREIQPANSTADAVRIAVESSGTAAIGTELAAQLYGAEVIEPRIEDHASNQTRFVLIGHGEPARTGRDKTSLALFLKADKPGALLMILSEFAYGNINLTKIQSRPTKRAMGEYMFFVDLEGHVDEPDVKTALDSLRLKLREVKVLGSYPRA